MSSKKKILISISAFAVLVLAAVVAVVAVLAAQSVKVTSSINVQYTAQEVAGTMTAKYKVAGGTEQNIGTGSVTFTGAETTPAETNKSLTNTDLEITSLTSANKSVEFIFTFTNTGSAAYTATVVLPATNTNFTVAYSVPNAGGATKVSDLSFKVAGNTTTPVTYKVTYTISNVANDATLDGDFAWTLEKV